MSLPVIPESQRPLSPSRVDVRGSHKGALLPYEQMRDDLGPVLFDFLKNIDVSGRGVLQSEDLEEAADIVRLTRGAKEHNAGQLSYKHLPGCVQQVLTKWDTDQNGFVSIEELQAAAHAHKQQKQKTTRARWMVVVLVFAIALVGASTFVMALAAFEMAKELKTGNSGVILTKDGSPARIASADTEVQDGILVARDVSNSTSNNLSMAVATRPAEVERPLSSTIPDRLLAEMMKLTISGADGVSHMTLHILGFTRVLAPSRCGSLVYLSSHLGTVTLDDTELHFDDALAAHAATVGMIMEGSSVHGRRLASTSFVVGVFNFFEEYDWQCSSVLTPQSPTKPYIMKTLKRVPCPSLDQCTSSVDSDVMLSGFDEDANSIIIAETIAETDDFTLSIQRYPNHPLQMLVTITDHKQQTHRGMQIFNNTGFHCVSRNYSDAIGNSTDTLNSYFPAFLGKEVRPTLEFNLPWGRAVIPERSVRSFRLQPKDDIDGALPIPIDYDDDAETLLPTRLFFNGAKDMALDVEEILVESLQQNVSEAAEELRRSLDVDCAVDEIFGLPVMTSPFTEKEEDVDFYVQRYVELQDFGGEFGMSQTTNDYWMQALQREDVENLGNQSSADSRALLSKRLPRRLQDVDGGFELDIGEDASIYASTGGNCFTMGGETSNPASPWSFGGELNMGKGCEDPASQFTIDGRVGVNYGWETEKKYKIKVLFWKATVNLECGLGISGYIGGRTGSYKYKCGRRLEAAEQSAGDELIEQREPSEAHLVNKSDVSSGEDLDLEEDDEAPKRRLFGRRRRRRRTCTKAGFEVIAGVGVGGGCGVSRRRIGVTLEGGLDLSIGPWPDPLDARAKGYISAKGCIKLGPFKGCIGLPSVKLFDVNI